MVSVRLVYWTPDGELLVALAAKRTLNRRPSIEIEKGLKLSSEEVERWIVETFRRQHFSVWEFSWYIFEVECSRVCSHQLVRHRIASYAQLSQRYSDNLAKYAVDEAVKVLNLQPCHNGDYECYARVLEKALEVDDAVLAVASRVFVIPPKFSELGVAKDVAREYLRSLATYYRLLARGVPPEDARFVLPQSVKTRLLVGMNARELLHFLSLRMCRRAQWEIRAIAWRLWYELVKVHPRLFRFVGPRCVMTENVVRPQPITVEDVIGKRVELTIARCPEGVDRASIYDCVRMARDEVLQNA